MKRKIFAAALAALIVSGVMTACGSESADNNSKSENTTTTTTAPAETEATTESAETTTTAAEPETETTTTTTAEPETETTTTTEAVTETEPVESSESDIETEATTVEEPEETGIVTMADNPDGMYPFEECFRRKAEEYSKQKVISIDIDCDNEVYEATLEDGQKAYLSVYTGFSYNPDELYSIDIFEFVGYDMFGYAVTMKLSH